MTIPINEIRSSLQDTYGESVTSADIRAWCAMNGANYQSITRRLEKEGCKSGRGKWNLQVTKETVQDLEVSYNAPAAMPAIEQNLIPSER